jgi:hypothetical protein
VHTDSPVKAAVCNFLFPVFLDDFFQQWLTVYLALFCK